MAHFCPPTPSCTSQRRVTACHSSLSQPVQLPGHIVAVGISGASRFHQSLLEASSDRWSVRRLTLGTTFEVTDGEPARRNSASMADWQAFSLWARAITSARMAIVPRAFTSSNCVASPPTKNSSQP